MSLTLENGVTLKQAKKARRAAKKARRAKNPRKAAKMVGREGGREGWVPSSSCRVCCMYICICICVGKDCLASITLTMSPS
jgi:hypothetical protein